MFLDEFSQFVLVMAFPFSFVLLFGFVAAFGVMAPVLKAQKQAQTMLVLSIRMHSYDEVKSSGELVFRCLFERIHLPKIRPRRS